MPAETPPSIRPLPPFAAAFAPDDAKLARLLFNGADASPAVEGKVDATALRLIDAIRSRSGGIGGVEEILREYSLSTKEGPGAHGARRSAAARAGRRHRRPPDRGQARPGRFRASRDEIGRASRLGLGLGALDHLAHHPARRDAAQHRGGPRQAHRPACGAQRDPPGDARHGQSFRAGRDDRGGAQAGRLGSRAPDALFLRHAGRRRAHGRGREALLRELRRRHRGDRPCRRQHCPCRKGPASR